MANRRSGKPQKSRRIQLMTQPAKLAGQEKYIQEFPDLHRKAKEICESLVRREPRAGIPRLQAVLELMLNQGGFICKVEAVRRDGTALLIFHFGFGAYVATRTDLVLG